MQAFCVRKASRTLRSSGLSRVGLTTIPATSTLLIETAEDHRLTVFDLVEIGERLSSSYGRHVDLIPAGALRARHADLREEAVRAF